MQHKSKIEVNYRIAQGDERCDNCDMSHFTDGSDAGTCDEVVGPIVKAGTCDDWEAK